MLSHAYVFFIIKLRLYYQVLAVGPLEGNQLTKFRFFIINFSNYDWDTTGGLKDDVSFVVNESG